MLTSAQADLIIRAGRVFCEDTGLDGPGAVLVSGDRILKSGPDVASAAKEVIDFPDCLLLPGMVDLHAHPAPAGWKYGIDPDVEILPRGTTTILSQGDAGAAVWPQYRDEIIEGSRTRVLLAISPAEQGESLDVPVFGDLDRIDIEACLAAVEDGGGHIWGIAHNAAAPGSGSNAPRELIERTLAIAERSGKPLLYGVRKEPSDWPLAEQLALLRPGDVVTYCYQGNAESIVARGRVVDSAWEARGRGVLFDIGHGMSSFDFNVAEAAIEDGFPPDTISTDQYIRHVGSQPQHDMARTVSKLIAAGLPESDALARATHRPAQVLGLAGEIGTLAPGACADLAVLRWNPDAAPLADVAVATRPGGCWEPVLAVRAGKVVR